MPDIAQVECHAQAEASYVDLEELEKGQHNSNASFAGPYGLHSLSNCLHLNIFTYPIIYFIYFSIITHE